MSKKAQRNAFLCQATLGSQGRQKYITQIDRNTLSKSEEIYWMTELSGEGCEGKF